MSNSRFLTTDYLDPIDFPGGQTLVSPSPGTAAGYAAANIFTRDRHTIWKIGSTPSTDGAFKIDLGIPRTIGALAVCGEEHRAWGSSLGPGCYFGYNDDGGSTWTSAGSFGQLVWGASGSPVVNDYAIVLTTPIEAQFWRVWLYSTAAFSVGKIFLGSLADMGMVYSPGSTIQSVRQRTRHNVNGALAIHETGPAYKRFGLRFDKANRTTQASLDSLHTLGRPFVYLDKNNKVYHVELDDDLLSTSHAWGNATADYYDSSLNLVQLV